jgi:serine/threonine-protein kinase
MPKKAGFKGFMTALVGAVCAATAVNDEIRVAKWKRRNGFPRFLKLGYHYRTAGAGGGAASDRAMSVCPKCNNVLSAELQFCPYDGTRLNAGLLLRPGAVIRNKYEIVDQIGSSGMGVVFRAQHLIWKEEKAIKVLNDSMESSADARRNFLAEAQILRKLVHENVVTVEDVDYTDDSRLFIVMELIQGEDLHNRLQRTGPLAQTEAVVIAVKACAALEAAHGQGIIHRDVKPHNILLGRDAQDRETVKLIDFGLAKVREHAQSTMTGSFSGSSGMFVGTPAYASPEQVSGKVDARTDLYSLGLVIYEMLTGRAAFDATNTFVMLVQRQQITPEPPDRKRPDLNISPELSAVVMKALERDPEKRYPSAREMGAALRPFLPPVESAPAPEIPVRQSQPDEIPTVAIPVEPQPARPEPAQDVPVCTVCRKPVGAEYHYRNNKVVCTPCRQRVEQERLRAGSFGLALVSGLGTMVTLALALGIVYSYTGFRLPYSGTAIGICVGLAIRKASGSYGGVRYQILAVVVVYLTYAAGIVMPLADATDRVAQARHVSLPVRTAAHYANLYFDGLLYPFAAMPANLNDLIAIGVGLAIAWKATERADLGFTGPLTVGPSRRTRSILE